MNWSSCKDNERFGRAERSEKSRETNRGVRRTDRESAGIDLNVLVKVCSTVWVILSYSSFDKIMTSMGLE